MEEFLGLRPYNDFSGVQALGDMWSLHRPGQTLRCALTTHPLGWELRAVVGEELMRSIVCKTQDAVFDTAAAWKAEALQNFSWSYFPEVDRLLSGLSRVSGVRCGMRLQRARPVSYPRFVRPVLGPPVGPFAKTALSEERVQSVARCWNDRQRPRQKSALTMNGVRPTLPSSDMALGWLRGPA